VHENPIFVILTNKSHNYYLIQNIIFKNIKLVHVSGLSGPLSERTLIGVRWKSY
jgi:hypothetical protein